MFSKVETCTGSANPNCIFCAVFCTGSAKNCIFCANRDFKTAYSVQVFAYSVQHCIFCASFAYSVQSHFCNHLKSLRKTQIGFSNNVTRRKKQQWELTMDGSRACVRVCARVRACACAGARSHGSNLNYLINSKKLKISNYRETWLRRKFVGSDLRPFQKFPKGHPLTTVKTLRTGDLGSNGDYLNLGPT